MPELFEAMGRHRAPAIAHLLSLRHYERVLDIGAVYPGSFVWAHVPRWVPRSPCSQILSLARKAKNGGA